MSQTQYVEKVPEVFISASRKKDLKSETTEKEKSALRATLGALSWHAQASSTAYIRRGESSVIGCDGEYSRNNGEGKSTCTFYQSKEGSQNDHPCHTLPMFR